MPIYIFLVTFFWDTPNNLTLHRHSSCHHPKCICDNTFLECHSGNFKNVLHWLFVLLHVPITTASLLFVLLFMLILLQLIVFCFCLCLHSMAPHRLTLKFCFYWKFQKTTSLLVELLYLAWVVLHFLNAMFWLILVNIVEIFSDCNLLVDCKYSSKDKLQCYSYNLCIHKFPKKWLNGNTE